MKTINGLTEQQTIKILKKYAEYRLGGEYICNYINFNFSLTLNDNFEFITYWVKKFYGKVEHNKSYGYFGDIHDSYKNDSDCERMAFVLLLIHELENN